MEYTIIIINLFHVLLNNIPQLLIQSVFFKNNNINWSILNLLQITKIFTCVLKTSWLSINLVKHFLKNEFNCKIKLNKKISIVNKFLSNLLTLTVRFYPIVFLIREYQSICCFLVANRFLISLIYTFISIYFNRNLKIKINIVSIFWFFVLSMLRANVFIDNFKFNSFIFVYSCLEYLVYFYLITICYKSIISTIFIFLIMFIIFIVNILNEYLFWNYYFYLNGYDNFKDLFNQWLHHQQQQQQQQETMIIKTQGEENHELKSFI